MIVENTSEEDIYVEPPSVVQSGIFVNPVIEDGKVSPGMVGVFRIVVDFRNRILSMDRETEYISDPSNLTIFTFQDSSTKAIYIVGEITRAKLANAGLIDETDNWTRSPTTVMLGVPVTGIGDNVFDGCSDLVTIGRNMMTRDISMANTLPDTITRIGREAFKGCSSLGSIVVPDSVQEIGYAAFNGCSSLETMQLPFTGVTRNVTEGEDGLFGQIFGDEEYEGSYVAGQHCTTTSESVVRYIPESLREVKITDQYAYGVGTFSGCQSLTSVELEYEGDGSHSVTSLVGTFYECNNLETVSIPETIETIGDYTFCGCHNLANRVSSPNIIPPEV